MTPDEMAVAACDLIARLRSDRKCMFIAIDGCAGAGKSTLARGIAARLSAAAIVRTDHFFRPLSEYPAGSLTPERAYELYFPWTRMRDEALMPLSLGQRAVYRRHEWTTNAPGELITIDPARIVIVEGVYSSRPELRHLLDAAIFVDAPPDLRRKRLVDRAPGEDTGWIAPWTAAEDWYLDALHPRDRADLVLSST